MIIFILLLEIRGLDIQQTCHCDSLLYQGDCGSFWGCFWNSTSSACQDLDCYMIPNQSDCISQSWRCAWTNYLCIPFTSCSNLEGTTQGECLMQNLKCQSSDGKVCGVTPHTCQSLTTPQTCNGYYSGNGQCIWNQNSCQPFTSCSGLSNCRTPCYLNGTTCELITCSYYKSPAQCKYVIQLTNYYEQFQSCSWNYTTSLCETTQINQLNATNCFTSTLGTYSWNSTNPDEGECQSCFYPIMMSFIIHLLVY